VLLEASWKDGPILRDRPIIRRFVAGRRFVIPLASYLHDALMFAAYGLGLALIATLVRSQARNSMLVMLIVVTLGVLGLWFYESQASYMRSATASILAREALLALIRAPGFGKAGAGAVLDALNGIGSDYECREVLIALARVMPTSAALVAE